MASYQWIVNFTTTSPIIPLPPPLPSVVSMLDSLFVTPTNVWLAGPQSVDDGDLTPPETIYQWMIYLTSPSTKRPSDTELETALEALFGSTVDNVWLAGPQSVDDGPADTIAD